MELETLKLALHKPSRDAMTGMQLSDAANGTVFVEAINEEGIAFAAGVRVGDTVFSVNGEAVSDHEQGALLVKAAEGVLEVGIIRSSGGAADALGSGESLESLGVDLASVLPQRSAPVDLREAEAHEMPAIIVGADGRNLHALACKFCGCAILPVGKVVLVPDLSLSMPPMPRTRSAASAGGSEESTSAAEQVTGFWRAADKYDFDNLGVTRAAGEVAAGESQGQELRFLMCADCGLGPFGWFADSASRGDKLGEGVDFFVATDRVRYVGGGSCDVESLVEELERSKEQ